MRIVSPLSKEEYLSALKDQMGGHCEFGSERFTGFFLGKWFHVTHHAGFEWNRKYTNEKNAAVGHVVETENGCEVRFLTFKGALVPAQFLSLLILMIPIILIMALSQGDIADFSILQIILFCLIVVIPSSLLATFFESFTTRSAEGKRILLALLLDPSDPFSYLNNLNELP